MRYKIIELIVTSCYVGKINFAPGTFGSLLAFPIYAFLSHMFVLLGYTFPFQNYSLIESQVMTFVCFMLIVTLLIFICGVITSTIYLKYTNKDDPKEVVIDEVVGQLLTITLTIFISPLLLYNDIGKYINPTSFNFITGFIIPFISFRFFDIIKPWPIDYIDQNIKGGLGVMLDDVVASILASIFSYAVLFLIIQYYS